MSEDQTKVSVAGGFASWKLSAHAVLNGVAGIVFGAACVLWYWLEPPGKFVPVAVASGMVGWFLARASSEQVTSLLKEEVERWRQEVARMAQSKEKLEQAILTKRATSDRKRRGK